jgi:hypothetical protein
MRDGGKPYGAAREKGRSRKNHENWKSVCEGCPRRSAVNKRANHPVALEPIKTEGSTVASAAVASPITVDKVSGFFSRAAVAEINKFLHEKCKEEGGDRT